MALRGVRDPIEPLDPRDCNVSDLPLAVRLGLLVPLPPPASRGVRLGVRSREPLSPLSSCLLWIEFDRDLLSRGRLVPLGPKDPKPDPSEPRCVRRSSGVLALANPEDPSLRFEVLPLSVGERSPDTLIVRFDPVGDLTLFILLTLGSNTATKDLFLSESLDDEGSMKKLSF